MRYKLNPNSSKFLRTPSYKTVIKAFLPWLLIVLASLIILLPEIIGSHMIVGDDCWFHMNRAYEDMEQIKTGHFSYFMNLFSFESSGRIVNGLYGPVGGYIEGLLLLIAKTWYHWEIWNSLIVLVASGLSVYYVARKLNASYLPSMFAGIMYMTTFPFERWVLNQNFDGFGAVVLPYFLLAGYRILRHHFSSVKLAILVAIMSQLHLMSTFIGVISLLISFILANFHSGRLRLWIKALESTGLGLLLTVNVWGSLFEVKGSNYLVPTFPYHNPLSPGYSIHAFMIMQPLINHTITELVLFLILGLGWIIFRKTNLIVKFLTIQSLLFLWLSSKYFIWSLLLKHDSMVASYIQFPERFFPIAIAASLLLIVQLKPHCLISIVLLLFAVINVNFDVKNEQNAVNGQYHNLVQKARNVRFSRFEPYHSIQMMFHSDDDGKFIHVTSNRVPDYMPFSFPIAKSSQYYRQRPDRQNYQDVIANRLPVRRVVSGRDVMKLSFNTQSGRQVQLPFVKYRHTQLWLNHHLINPRLNQIGAIEIHPRKRHNVLEAQYQPSHWYNDLAIVEILAWLIIIIGKMVEYKPLKRI